MTSFKTIFASSALTLCLSASAFAADMTAGTAVAPQDTTKAAVDSAKPAATGKMTWKAAKAACLSETPTLKGKDLKTCIKSKKKSAG